MSDPFFDKVYAARGDVETRDLYDAWAKSYDTAVEDEGYATPGRCATALFAAVPDPAAPILDFGCGTGISGLALRDAGFSLIDGVDLSEGMLAHAREKGLYRSLRQIDADDPVPEGYSAIAAIGVIGSGAAPISAFDRILEALAPGALFVFSFNDHTLEDPVFTDRVAKVIASGTCRERFREYGPHLPGKNMNSTVYVLEKA